MSGRSVDLSGGRAEAVATVLAAAEAGDGTVEWADVDGDVPAEVWGHLVASGVLVPVDDRFVIDDPDAVREAVAAADGDGSVTIDAGDGIPGWSRADKLVGVGALTLASGYQVGAVRTAVGRTLDVFLGPLHAVLPFPVVVAVVALLAGLASTVVQRRVGVDTSDHVERVRAGLSEVENRIEDARDRDDERAVAELQGQRRTLVRRQFRTMGAAFRPVAWTMLATVPVLLWLYWLVLSPNQAIAPVASVLPVIGEVVWTGRLVAGIPVWMAWYFVCSMGSRLVATRTRGLRRRLPTPS